MSCVSLFHSLCFQPSIFVGYVSVKENQIMQSIKVDKKIFLNHNLLPLTILQLNQKIISVQMQCKMKFKIQKSDHFNPVWLKTCHNLALKTSKLKLTPQIHINNLRKKSKRSKTMPNYASSAWTNPSTWFVSRADTDASVILAQA